MTTSTYSIAQLKQDWEALMHGTSLNDIQNPNDIINRAARDCLMDVDFWETKRVSQITGGVFDSDTGVYNYLLPADLKRDKLVDIRPQVNRFIGDNPIQHTSKEFDLYKSIQGFVVDSDTGLRFLRLAVATTPPNNFNGLDAVSGSNGTNAADGVIFTSLAADNLYRIFGSASLSFNISGAGTGYIENSTLSSVDLSTATGNGWSGVASVFIWVYIPTSPSNVTSVSLRWGSSSSNYWSGTATTNFWSQSFVTGWNLVSVAWPTTSTGSPDASKLTYMRASLTWTGGAQNTFRMDRMFFALPTIYELEYYSKYLFQNSSGTWQETTANDTDLVNLDTDSYNILLYKCAELAALQLQQAIPLRGKLINFDQQMYGGMYDSAIQRYRDNYKTEALKVISSYYRNRYIRQR